MLYTNITIICILMLIIFILIYFLIAQRSKYLAELLDSKKETGKELDRCKFYLKENINLKKRIIKYENYIYSKVDTFNVYEGKVKKDEIYKGKKALIGDYTPISYFNTENVLRSLRFSVDVVPTVKDVVNKIKYGEHYDIIFTNKEYPHGTGEQCLKELKEIRNFNIPVVLHTITKGKRDFYVNEIGFDEYIEKPITQENVKIILEKLLKQ